MLAQRYAARLVTRQQPVVQASEVTSSAYHEVDVDSLELIRPRSIGIEQA